jgi:hypothetical protein
LRERRKHKKFNQSIRSIRKESSNIFKRSLETNHKRLLMIVKTKDSRRLRDLKRKECKEELSIKTMPRSSIKREPNFKETIFLSLVSKPSLSNQTKRKSLNPMSLIENQKPTSSKEESELINHFRHFNF